ncbi:hypothetical protein BH18ACT8_BH18ACT8_14420 [soil metagenome]
MSRWAHPVLTSTLVVLAATVLAASAGASAGAFDPVFPVRGATSYGSAHHDYPATDIFAACGSRVVAPIRGRVLEVSRRDRWDPATDRPADRGGKFVAIRGADGVRYYGSVPPALRYQPGVLPDRRRVGPTRRRPALPLPTFLAAGR